MENFIRFNNDSDSLKSKFWLSHDGFGVMGSIGTMNFDSVLSIRTKVVL